MQGPKRRSSRSDGLRAGWGGTEPLTTSSRSRWKLPGGVQGCVQTSEGVRRISYTRDILSCLALSNDYFLIAR